MATPDVAVSERKDDLHLPDPLWLWQLAEGAKRVLQGVLGAAIALLVFAGLAAVLAATGWLQGPAGDNLLGVLLPCGIGLGLLVLSGLWSLTSAEPGLTSAQRILSTGMLARTALAILIVATALATLSVPVAVSTWARIAIREREAIYLVTACVWTMLTALTACVAGRLRQTGARNLAKQAQALVWGFALAPAVGTLFGVLLLNDWEAVVLATSTVIWTLLLIGLLIVLGYARGIFARAAEEAWVLRTPPATLQVDEHGRIAMDVPCRQCGYNLRGLEPNVGCPECGAASKPSIDVHLLRAQDPIWPSEVATGMTWLLVTLSAGLILVTATRALYAATTWQGLPMSDWYGLISPIGSLLSLGTLVGIWKITTPTFGSRQASGERARKTARFCLWLRVVLTLRLPWLLSGGSLVFALTAAFAPGLLALIGWLALLRHCRRLAERAGDPLLAEHARRTARQVAWLLGLVFALTLWMNFDIFRLNWARAWGTATMPVGLSPWAVFREVLSWLTFGLHATFTVLMLRLAFAYRKRFGLIAQTNETPGAPAGTGLDVSPSGT